MAEQLSIPIGKRNKMYICKQCKETIPKGKLDNWKYARRIFCNQVCYSAYKRTIRHSKEYKRKMSEKLKGRKITWCNKLKGRKISKETREKIRKAHLGKKTSAKTKEKQRQAKLKNPTQLFGSSNPNWQGGPKKKKYLRDELKELGAYRLWRKAVFGRDRYTCQECSEKKKTLNAHHIIAVKDILKMFNIKTLEDALDCQLLWDFKNGITLCEKCHKLIHKKIK